MIKNVLTHIGGIENYGLISIGIFFTFFTAVLLWGLLQKSAVLNAISRIPLDNELTQPNPNPNPNTNASRHE